MGYRRWLYLLGIVAVNSLLFQSILVTVGNVPWFSSLQENHKSRDDFVSFPLLHSAPKLSTIQNPLTVGGSDSSDYSTFTGTVKNIRLSIVSEGTEHHRMRFNGMKNHTHSSTDSFGVGRDRNNIPRFTEKKADDNNVSSEFDDVGIRKNNGIKKTNLVPVLSRKREYALSAKKILKMESDILRSHELIENKNVKSSESERVYIHSQSPALTNLTHSDSNSSALSSLKRNDSTDSDKGVPISILGSRKMRCELPPKSRTLIQEMNRILVKRRAKSRAMV